MKESPKISAIVSTYNSEKLIASRINNLLQQEQDHLSVEVIVVDSGSTENEAAVVQEMQLAHRNIKYIRTERETLYAAWNRGIELATGNYITNSNTDDRLFAGAFSRMTAYLDSHQNIDLVYADVYQTVVLDEITTFDGTSKLAHWREITRLDYSHKELLLGCLCGPQPVWRSSLHANYGLFDDDYVVAGDYEFWLRIAEHVKFQHIAEPLGLVYKNIHGLEWRNRNLLTKENLRIRTQYFKKPQASAAPGR